MLPLLPVFWGLALLVICWAAAIKDLYSYTIPHIYPVLIIALFGFGLFFINLTFSFLAWQTACVALAFVAGFFLFMLNLMGGGDVKLFAALGLWIPIAQFGIFLFLVTFFGALSAIIVMLYRARKFLKMPEHENAGFGAAWNAVRKTKHPYGPAIALGTSVFWILEISAGKLV